ncbi:MAG TPA: acetate/propionate family kinase [Agriterribacter sp.]|nr:acetate/propionate family kinase [Agriterribacter sp.]
MKASLLNILTINSGSSSIKFGLYEIMEKPQLLFAGKIDRIGLADTAFTIKRNNGNSEKNRQEIGNLDFHTASAFLLKWLQQQSEFGHIKCIGHRIVHGMTYTEPAIIDDDLLKELNNIRDYDPGHLPAEIEIIQIIKQKHPNVMQVACFDTAFHTTIPLFAKIFAIPRKYYREGIQRFGFHGISYSYLMEELKKKNEKEAKGRIILAHLGNGASLAAVKDGKCMDTSMGFTPAGGIVMSTRSGDVDPGVAWYLMQKGMNAKEFNDVINHQSGLLGISETTSDMQDLLKSEKEDERAAEAVNIFCYQIKKYIGAYTAALEGLDILVFSGGIGENAPVIRSRICEGFRYAGVELNEEQNQKNAFQISAKNSTVEVYVVPTDEEVMIAKTTADIWKRQTNTN